MSTYLQQLLESMKLPTSRIMLLLCAAMALPFATNGQQDNTIKTKQTTEKQEQSWQLLIAGGGLKICSSLQQEHCINAQFSENSLNEKLYILSAESLKQVVNTDAFQQLNEIQKAQLNTVFEYFYANPVSVNSTQEIRNAFEQAIDQFDAGSLFVNLPNALYYAITDFTEQHANQREQVLFSASQNNASKSLFSTFVEQANLKRTGNEPLSLVFTTASGRDPYSAIDFYQQTLTQAASKIAPEVEVKVQWLPLDESLMQLLATQQSCEQLAAIQASQQLFNRDTVYPQFFTKQQEVCEQPEMLVTMLDKAHGLFINGGDQLRTYRAMSTETATLPPLSTLIKQRIEKQKMILAGTSAGAAVMAGGTFDSRPVPMITSGQSDVALVRGAFALPPAPFGCEKDQNCPNGLLEDDLTYQAQGGLGVFNMGTLDTHFSERDRQGRLVMLSAFTKTRFAFGIDENTALLVKQAQGQTTGKVIGEGGVFIADMQDAIFKAQSGKHQLIGLHHYLNNNDEFSYSADSRVLQFTLAMQSKAITQKSLVLVPKRGEFRRQVALNCGTQQFHRWTLDNIAWLVNPSEDSRFALNVNDEQDNCSYLNLLFGVEN